MAGNLALPGQSTATGFSLVEILVVIVIGALIILPLGAILRQGTQSSLKSLIQVQTTVNGRLILRQIRNDLEHSCFYSDPATTKALPTLDSVFSDMSPNSDITRYRFLAFPRQVPVEDAIVRGKDDSAFRQVSRITYELRPAGKEELYKELWRVEEYPAGSRAAAENPQGRRSLLGNRVNSFQIIPQEVSFSGSRHFFRVNLRLIDAPQGNAQEGEPSQASVENLLARSRGYVIADFFDVVSSDFYVHFWNFPGVRPAWNTVISRPDFPSDGGAN